MTGLARVGCSGWHYAGWRGRWYPPELPAREWLRWYATRFDAVEVNATHYRDPPAGTVERWVEQVPPDFRFAMKANRFATHRRRLLDPEGWAPRVLAVAERFGPALAAILVQLPPRWRPEPDRLDAALAALGRRWPIAVEVRDPRWLHEEVLAVLGGRGAALCWNDLVPDHPRVVTAPFTYLRFHGPDPDRPYHERYSRAHRRSWSAWVAEQARHGLDVHVYFDNDVGAAAPRDAAAFRRVLTARQRASRSSNARNGTTTQSGRLPSS